MFASLLTFIPTRSNHSDSTVSSAYDSGSDKRSLRLFCNDYARLVVDFASFISILQMETMSDMKFDIFMVDHQQTGDG